MNNKYKENKETNKNMRQEKIVRIKLDDSQAPFYSSTTASGADVRSKDDIVLQPHERSLIHTGIYMEMPENLECQVRPRSGLALKHGITVLNSPGTIDSDYRGECNVILLNTSDEPFEIKRGDRIAQFVFVDNVVHAIFEEVKELASATERGEGGFGHSGVK